MKPQTIQFLRAQETLTENGVPNVIITFDNVIPSNLSLKDAQQQFASDGKLLAQTLLQVLPGGTYSQLLSEMLKQRASHFVVSFENSLSKSVDSANG